MAQRRGCFGAAQPTGRGYSGLRSQSGGGFAARADWRSAGDVWGCAAHWPGMFRGCAVNPAAVSQPCRGCFGAAQAVSRSLPVGADWRSAGDVSGLRSQSGGGFAALAGDIRGCAAHWPGMFRGCAVNPAAVSQPLPGIFGAAQPTGRGCFGAARRFRSLPVGADWRSAGDIRGCAVNPAGGFRSPRGRGCAVNPAAVSQPAPGMFGLQRRPGIFGAAQSLPGMFRGCAAHWPGIFGAAQSIRRRFRSPRGRGPAG